MSRKDEWLAEMLLYESLYRSITQRKTKIIEIPSAEGELGYTSSDGRIHLARRHRIMRTLKEQEKQFFRMGVFAHEMCHQIFTDFAYLEETLRSHNWQIEQRVIGLFANLVEDPAIEYEAETEFGGNLLAALRFSIAHIYRTSPNLQTSDDPFSQLCTALIQFGDMGLLKGHFTSKEAFEYFRIIAPEFNEAVTNPEPKARIDAAVRWADLTRPLWEKDNAAEEQNFIDNVIDEIEKDNAISKSEGSGSAPKSPSSKPEENEKQSRRNEMVKKIQSDESENNQQEGTKEDVQTEAGEECNNDDSQGSCSSANEPGISESSEGQNENTETSKEQNEESQKVTEDKSEHGEESFKNESDESTDKDKKTSENSKSSARNDSEQEDADESSETSEGSKGSGTPSSENVDDKNSDSNSGNEDLDKFGGGHPSWDTLSEFETEDDGKSVTKTETKKMDKEMLGQIRSSIERSADGIAARRKRDQIDYTAKSKRYENVKCLNEVMTTNPGDRNAYQSEYARVLKKHAKDISLLTGSLRRIFQQDVGENIRALSGRYNVVRASKQSTAKIFDRRKLPKNLDDLAVMLLIDESGSMSYFRKADIARETAIILAESFASLNIPCYIMGFTTGSKYDAVHHHYVSWKNTKEERLTLAGISAQNSNFDGYSIRNATMILKKKAAEHKILFIISDGYPACRLYRSQSDGVADTKEAIQEAKKAATVLGIGIGDCEPETLKHMYKGSFVHAKNADDLSVTLTRNLKKILKNY